MSRPVSDPGALRAALDDVMAADRHGLARRLADAERRFRAGRDVAAELTEIAARIDASRRRRALRRWPRALPEPPAGLPITEHLGRIAELLDRHQTVIVCGETGSGKTTQLPQLCLRLGRGTAGMIAHTQPRRIAARSVAARIAEELGVTLGCEVGFKVRFSDRTDPDTRLKLVTDGMLLAEIRRDRFLTAYDTIIVDEAHERSLNIDFLFGYLHDLLPRRPDLKLLITSATIDASAFSRHFDGAPVVEVAGRGHPIEIRYRPAGDDDDDPWAGLVAAVDELFAEGPGDILVFLSGEREIREAEEALRHHRHRGVAILPLYARLGAARQQEIFHPSGGQRIVLATNVAETSLTVPGIRYVIDAGFARISRYSHRSKVQRLPIEAISKASARQRAGRCGRTGPGICIRLYGEDDFESRPAQTEPEIQRTNLASVILQMAQLGLGRVEEFPFIDPPHGRLVKDGYRLLVELGALDDRRRLTPLGRNLARLMVDPRHGRMLLAAAESGCLREVLVIVSALAGQDPRERPAGREAAAAERHREFVDDDSDFLGLWRLWQAVDDAFARRSRRRQQVYCRERFLSWRRLREWRETHRQLLRSMTQMGFRVNTEPASYETIHKALMSGLLGHLARHDDEGEYLGARGVRWRVFPGSGLARRRPRWLMAALLQETSRLYGHVVARIEPAWIEAVAPEHLLRRHHYEPHWEKRRGQAVCFEQVTLYGLQIVSKRRVALARIDPEASRRLFVEALAAGDVDDRRLPFIGRNRARLRALEELEDKLRRRGVVIDAGCLADRYDERLPAGIVDVRALERWWRRASDDEREALSLDEADLRRDAPGETDVSAFPDTYHDRGLRLPLRYRFSPGEPDDGVTVMVPLPLLGRLDPQRLEWLVPGLLADKVLALIRALPKSWRRRFIPAQSFATACVEAMRWGEGRLVDAIARELARMTGAEPPRDAWSLDGVPDHLRMRIEVVDEDGAVLADGRDLERLRARFSVDGERPASKPDGESGDAERTVESWSDIPGGRLPEAVRRRRHGIEVIDHPALACIGRHLRLVHFDDADTARREHARGIRRLLVRDLSAVFDGLWRGLPGRDRWSLAYLTIGPVEALRDHWAMGVCREAMAGIEPPRDDQAWVSCREAVRRRLPDLAADYGELLAASLERHARIRKRIKAMSSPAYLMGLSDVQIQLGRLMAHGFVEWATLDRLRHYPRYLDAVLIRLERLEQDPRKDRERQLTIAALMDRCGRRWSGEAARAFDDEVYWLCEELRVSVFAQPLRTAVKVSVKRIESCLSAP